MSGRLNITVMLGGPSAEREVSLRSGAAVVSALRSLGHLVSELDPRDDNWVLPAQTDVVFLALHGTYGEDGTVQRRLDELGVPYTGCGAEASDLAFNKIKSKVRFEDFNVPTAKYWWGDTWSDSEGDALQKTIKSWSAKVAGQVFNEVKLSLPLVVKPSCQGSSVGLFFVERKEDLAAAVFEAFRVACDGDLKNIDFASKRSAVLIEEQIIGRETTVGILDGKALPIVEVRPKAGSYDYQNKYTSGRTEYFCPADFDAATTQRIQVAALGAFNAVGGRDYARVDVMVQADGSPVVLEVNTLPGMTETSLLPKAAAAAGISFPQLCQQMVELAVQRNEKLKMQNEKTELVSV